MQIWHNPRWSKSEPWDLAHDRDAWIEVMVANPILIERPIILADDGGAIVARPPERVAELLDPS